MLKKLETLHPDTYQVQVASEGSTKVFSFGAEVIDFLSAFAISNLLASALEWIAGRSHKAILKNLNSGKAVEVRGGIAQKNEDAKDYVRRIALALLKVAVDEDDPAYRSKCRYALHAYSVYCQGFKFQIPFDSLDEGDIRSGLIKRRRVKILGNKVGDVRNKAVKAPMWSLEETLKETLAQANKLLEASAEAAPAAITSPEKAVKPARKKAAKA